MKSDIYRLKQMSCYISWATLTTEIESFTTDMIKYYPKELSLYQAERFETCARLIRESLKETKSL